MIQLKETTTISLSPSEVFAFLADLDDFPKWRRANPVSFKVLTAGPTKVGTHCTEVMQIGASDGQLRCDGIRRGQADGIQGGVCGDHLRRPDPR